MASERATWSAQLSGDPVMPAMALWMRMWDTWASADWDDALARTAAERVNAYVGPEIHDRHSVTFSLGNVIVHSVSAALELSAQTKALRLSGEADPAHIRVVPNSRLGHTTWISPARGCGTGTATRP